MSVCLLIRHGRTAANTAGVLAGWSEGVELDEVGAEQVAQVAQQLSDVPVRRIVASPLTRCQQTAQALAARTGVGMETDDRLGECRYGDWTGRSISDLTKEPLWQVVQQHPSAARFPDGPSYPGESIASMAHRAVAAVREIDAAVAAEHGEHAVWVAVSHGDVIKAVVAEAAGTHLDLFQRYVVDPASVCVIRYAAGRPFVVRVNDSATSLATLLAPPPEHPTDGVAASDAVVGGGAGAPSKVGTWL
ncbi:MAG: MSMEG_4193 family putative phosphomutase [Austwickia sp.]|nr:MSMEG_4193 family putative phosphomutase [Austwickia sp.]MBK8435310.1 MSMEG_4193 family putative phosphomutase [Austwickia sp.]MBK9101140.1 MSMEG_4193 family putative phosphomutase [Austwickia sp.]